MFEFIVEFDYICVKYITELQKFKHFKYWFGVCIRPYTGCMQFFE